jgi:hypothetical protein
MLLRCGLVIILIIKTTLVFSNDFTWDFDTAIKDNYIKKPEHLYLIKIFWF